MWFRGIILVIIYNVEEKNHGRYNFNSSNGFDIAMGRKTKYTDFIEFEKQLFSNPDEELLEFLKAKNISIEKYKDNLYLKFINENEETLGINWIEY